MNIEKKNDKNGKVNLITGWGKISFPQLKEPRAFDQRSKPKFSAGLYLLRETAETQKLIDTIQSMIEELGLDKPVMKAGKQIVMPYNLPIKFKDEIVKNDGSSAIPAQLTGLDVVLLKASTGEGYPPQVVDANAKVIDDVSIINGGDVCRLRVTLAGYETPASRGITAYLQGVQLKRHASDSERFSGGSGLSAVADEADEWDMPF